MSNKGIISTTYVKKSYQLYGLYCPYTSNLMYVGITTGLLSTRLSGHLRNPTNGKIALWFKELKINNKKPIIKLIRDYKTYDDLLLGEINEIKENRKKNVNLLNVSDGGDINPMFGKTHTEEARLKISKNNKGLKRSEEQIKHKKELLTKLWSNEEWAKKVKAKMIVNMLGNERALGLKHSTETKKKMSTLHKGNKYMLGYKHSVETKQKMSENNSGDNNPMYGKVLSEDVLIKRSEKVKKQGVFKGKNNPNFKYDIKKDDLIDMFLIKDIKIDAIAKHYGCHRTVISDNLKKYNIKKPLSNKYNLNISEIKKYIDDNLSQVEIAKIYGCNNKIINKFIKKHKNG